MNVITNSPPDIWYDANDLHSHTKVIIRKQSVTCCGYSGGDFIHCINSPHDLISFLLLLTPQNPCGKQCDNDTELIELRDTWFSVLTDCYDEEKGWTADPEPIIAAMTDEIWFADNQPLIRFNLSMQGTLRDLLEQPVFSERLHAVLSWWYHNEAVPEEKENYAPILQKEVKEMGGEAIARAINLYNHGTYELTGLQ